MDMRPALLALALAAGPALSQDAPRFTVPRDTVLVDEKVPIVLSGARPASLVTIRLTWSDAGGPWSSGATFVADRAGRVDLGRHAPIAGSYVGVEPMGLFWSSMREGAGGPAVRPGRAGPGLAPLPFVLTAEADGRPVATDTVWRRAVAPGVRVTRVREGGVVGILLEPPGAGPHPAVIVLPGSQGGTPPPGQAPGGLASRGYVALSLAYFNEEGVPPQLASIPLEYFERALEWLRARPSVDSSRVAVMGASRGGELALLLGATYPRLVRAVVAHVPSGTVWSGCCDHESRLGPSWTLRGAALPFVPTVAGTALAVDSLARTTPVRLAPMFAFRLSDSAAAERAAIPVERIGGPVLLVSGRDDRLWPSYEMAEQAMARLKRHRFRHPYRHLSFEGAGHAMSLRPYGTTMYAGDNVHPVSGQRLDGGGTPALTARAREQAWAEVLAFLDRHLKGTRTPRP